MQIEEFLNLPAGRRMLNWEAARFDKLADEEQAALALQLGLPAMDCLKESSALQRVLVLREASLPSSPARPVLIAPFEDVPLRSGSVDFAALPHALDFCGNPAALVAELSRLVPEGGRIAVSGFCPVSLWTAREALRRVGLPGFLPQGARCRPLFRVRAWLQAAGFAIDRGAFGCYGPASASERVCRRFEWLDAAGDRWWPHLAGVWMVSAVRTSAGMTLVGKLPAAKRPGGMSREAAGEGAGMVQRRSNGEEP